MSSNYCGIILLFVDTIPDENLAEKGNIFQLFMSTCYVSNVVLSVFNISWTILT